MYVQREKIFTGIIKTLEIINANFGFLMFFIDIATYFCSLKLTYQNFVISFYSRNKYVKIKIKKNIYLLLPRSYQFSTNPTIPNKNYYCY